MSAVDPRLDRLPEFDERSRGFRAVAGIEDRPPRPYTWRCPVWLDQGREGACFPAGTLIRLADGSQRPIEKIRVLDRVLTAEGRTGLVLGTSARRAGDLVRLRLRGHQHLRCTPEHPVLARVLGGSRRRPTWAEQYVSVAELKSGDLVALPRYWPEPDDVIDIGALVNVRGIRGVIEGRVNTGGVMSEIAALPSLLIKTPGLGRLLGLYAAEGSTTPNKVVWAFGSHEDGLVAETVALIKAAFDAEARVQERPNNCRIVVLYGKTWRRLFEVLVPGTARHGDKRLSAHVTCGPPAFLEAILGGWQDGDGHRHRRCVQSVTVSHRLAMDMHAIATAAGLRPVLARYEPSMNQYAATRQRRWDLTIAEGNGANAAIQDEHAVWRKVTAIEPEPFEGWVFNLEVEGDHSYVAEGIGVHNCVGFSVTQEAAARPVVVAGLSDAHALHVYRRAQQLDQWPGEDYSGTSVLAGIKAGVELGWFGEYRWAFGEADLRLAVGWRGPAVAGVNWYDGMRDPDADGFIHPDGALLGGHAILVVGWSRRRDAYRLHNSWGRSWGDHGECWLASADMARLLAEDGEAVIPVTRRKPA